MKEKTFTLVGMSGAGKTTLAQKLSGDGFFHYSIDYEIAHTYLKDKIKESVVGKIKKQSSVFQTLIDKFAIKLELSLTFDDLEIITMFVIPQNDNGKIVFGEFLRNQELYRKAELLATQEFATRAKIAFENYRVSGFINDTTGSICEVALPNVNLIKEITQNSTVVYLQTTEAHRNILAERSKKAIKPILYNMDFLMKNLKSYYKKETFDKTFEINPEFFIELFPRLLEFRSRAYKEFVQKTNGKVIDVSLLHNTHSAREFLDVVNSN